MYKFEDIIEEVNELNTDLRYGLDDIVGVTIEKGLIPTIANLTQTALDKFYIIKPETFVYNPRTHGVRLGMGYNDTCNTYITSWNNVAFRVKNTAQSIVTPQYLWLYFCRPIWDKLTNFLAWGSSTIVFAWKDFLNIEIDLPSIEKQREVVAEYETLSNRIRLNEHMIANLEETAQALYRKMFVDGVDKEHLPEGWRKGTIGEFCDIITGKKDVNESFNEGLYRFFSCSPDPYYSNEFIAKGPAALIAGNGSYTGRVTYYDKEFDLYQRTYACLPQKEYKEIMPFIYCVLKFEFQTKFMGGSRGSSIPYIVRGDISDFEFAYKKDECLTFSNSMNVLLSNIQLKIEENEKLTELQSLLLARMGK